MRIDKLLHEVLSGRKAKLDDAGITVVEQAERREVAVGASDKQLGKAFGRVIDTALHSLTSGVERRMVIRSRRANRGVVVEIEYTSGSLKGTGAANVGGTSPTVRELAAYRRCFAEFGGRPFVSATPGGRTRLVIELPSRS